MKRQRTEGKRWRSLLMLAGGGVILLAVLLVLLFLRFGGRGGDGSPGELERIINASRQSRTVSQEEYEFFYQRVERDSPNRWDATALAEETRTYINEQNAMFYLAELAGLRPAFSFEGFKAELEAENQRRAERKEKGEAFYGLERYELGSYYGYVESNLKISLLQYLSEHLTAEMQDEAKTYFNEHIQDYRTIAYVTFQREKEGNIELVKLDYMELRTLEKTDGILSDFLFTAQQGEEMTYQRNGVMCTTTFGEMQFHTPEYDEVSERVLQDFIAVRYYDKLIQKIAENNPVSFAE